MPGASVNRRTAPLAPTRDFGRAVLGTVGPVTAEQLKEDPDLAPGDEIGQSGLQAAYERRLASTPDRRIVIRDRATGIADEALVERRGRRGRALRTTLDLDVQAAAEAALGARDGNAALVAVQPSTGDVLAVANRPADCAYDRALDGLYPPGSTFKVVSTAALLRAGLDPDRDRRLPADAGGRRASRSATSRATRPARCRSGATSRSPATRRSCRWPASSGTGR